MTEAEQRYIDACERTIAAQVRLINTLIAIANTKLEDLQRDAVDHIIAGFERTEGTTVN